MWEETGSTRGKTSQRTKNEQSGTVTDFKMIREKKRDGGCDRYIQDVNDPMTFPLAPLSGQTLPFFN